MQQLEKTVKERVHRKWVHTTEFLRAQKGATEYKKGKFTSHRIKQNKTDTHHQRHGVQTFTPSSFVVLHLAVKTADAKITPAMFLTHTA
jgi:hypothetical protein